MLDMDSVYREYVTVVYKFLLSLCYEEDMAEVKAIMDEVWRTQKAMLKKQPLIHNK